MSAPEAALRPTGMAFFQVSRSRIWAYAVQSDGEWRSTFGGQTLAQMREEMPDMELISTVDALKRENDGYRQPCMKSARRGTSTSWRCCRQWTGTAAVSVSRSSLRNGMAGM